MNWDRLEEHERLAREREEEDRSFSSSEEECDYEAGRSFLEVAACDEGADEPIVSGWESAYESRTSVPKKRCRKQRRSTLKVTVAS
jgi:hypothetical protein